MAETFAGTVSITPQGGGTATFVLEGDNGAVAFGGGDGLDGDLALKDATGQPRISLHAVTASVEFFNSAGDQALSMGPGSVIALGGAAGNGDLTLKDSAGQTRISLESAVHRMLFNDASGNEVLNLGPNGDIVLGGAGGADGDLTLKDGVGQTRISLNAQSHQMLFNDATGNEVLNLGPNGNIVLGGAGGADGDLTLKDGVGQTRISLNAQSHQMLFNDATGNEVLNLGPNGNIVLGGAGGADGDLTLKDGVGQIRITLNAQSHQMQFKDASGNLLLDLGPNGNIVLGGAGGADGDLTLKDGEGQARITLNAQSHQMLFRDASGNLVLNLGPNGNIVLGGAGGADGDLELKDGEGQTRISLNAQSHQMLFFDASGNQLLNLGPNGNIVLGGAGGADGDLILKDANSIDRITLDAQNHHITLRDDSGQDIGRIGQNANIKLGSGGHDGDVLLFPSSAANLDDDSQATIHLDANAGDITLRNADCAEDFEIEPSTVADPGTVMALGPDGRLRPSQRPHERAVVGVVSGGGKYRPGIVLDRQPGPGVRRPIALMGKAFVRVTDEAGPIEIGDLLTASSLPGVAMKAVDPILAFGAVIGKAIAPHRGGVGMIPMIIALQ